MNATIGGCASGLPRLLLTQPRVIIERVWWRASLQSCDRLKRCASHRKRRHWRAKSNRSRERGTVDFLIQNPSNTQDQSGRVGTPFPKSQPDRRSVRWNRWSGSCSLIPHSKLWLCGGTAIAVQSSTSVKVETSIVQCTMPTRGSQTWETELNFTNVPALYLACHTLPSSLLLLSTVMQIFVASEGNTISCSLHHDVGNSRACARELVLDRDHRSCHVPSCEQLPHLLARLA